MRTLARPASWAAAALLALVAGAARADAFDAEAAEARAQMRTAVAQMEGTAQRLRVLLRDARARREARTIGCLDDALSRADVALRRAKDLSQMASDAFTRKDVGEARRLMRALAATRDGAREASVLGDGCAAARLGFPAPDTTTVRVFVSRALPTEEKTGTLAGARVER